MPRRKTLVRGYKEKEHPLNSKAVNFQSVSFVAPSAPLLESDTDGGHAKPEDDYTNEKKKGLRFRFAHCFLFHRLTTFLYSFES